MTIVLAAILLIRPNRLTAVFEKRCARRSTSAERRRDNHPAAMFEGLDSRGIDPPSMKCTDVPQFTALQMAASRFKADPKLHLKNLLADAFRCQGLMAVHKVSSSLSKRPWVFRLPNAPCHVMLPPSLDPPGLRGGGQSRQLFWRPVAEQRGGVSVRRPAGGFRNVRQWRRSRRGGDRSVEE